MQRATKVYTASNCHSSVCDRWRHSLVLPQENRDYEDLCPRKLHDAVGRIQESLKKARTEYGTGRASTDRNCGSGKKGKVGRVCRSEGGNIRWQSQGIFERALEIETAL